MGDDSGTAVQITRDLVVAALSRIELPGGALQPSIGDQIGTIFQQAYSHVRTITGANLGEEIKSVVPFPAINSATIDDDTQHDDGFLRDARRAWPAAEANHDTSSACNNLMAAQFGAGSTGQVGVLVGHGNQGLINTGAGQLWAGGGDPKRTIELRPDGNNETVWGPLTGELRGKYRIVILWGCNVGAGQPGADLLFDLAKDANAQVWAPTGEVSFQNNGPAWESGSSWQVATPGQPKPHPLPPPSAPAEFWTELLLPITGGSLLRLPITAIESVKYSVMIGQSAGRQPVQLAGHTAVEFVRTIRFDQPHGWGPIGAFKTATMEVTYLRSSGLMPRKFVVYNDHALEDVDRPGIFYLTTAKYDEAVRSLTGSGAP